jgi:hypothetical protein
MMTHTILGIIIAFIGTLGFCSMRFTKFYDNIDRVWFILLYYLYWITAFVGIFIAGGIIHN